MGFLRGLSKHVVINIVVTVLVICLGHFIFYYFG